MDQLSQMMVMGAAGKKIFAPSEPIGPDTPIGGFVEGGFFAGFINEDGPPGPLDNKYAIIVAPKASGEGFPLLCKTSQTASPAATQTLNNGPAATAAMVAAGSHPAAAFCDGLTINGFSDWYLPARDELELCYRNLKPTTQANNTANRLFSAITYPEGNDVSSDTHGRNRNSDPAGAAYTSGNPAQTTVTAFITGNTEAFATGFYWSSSEFSASDVWQGLFSNGNQGTSVKDSGARVRAVRRAILSSIGKFFEGGFFAGFINEGGQKYAIIVAPKASGESASRQYKTTDDASPAATQTLNNGPAATAAMVAAGNHPAAAYCAALTINGFSDWYLPARDELELCYRNLKPTTQANNTSNRTISAITYPEGNDVSSDRHGRNRNSNPAGAAYTSGNPAQTSVSAFQSGNTEAFSGSYWSSSEFSAAGAWRQDFPSGGQDSGLKSFNRRVRAVRRLPV